MQFVPGCACCGCNSSTTKINFTITDACTTLAINGATITVIDSGGTTVGTCTTNSSGQCSVGISKNDTYHGTITKAGYCDGTFTGSAITNCASINVAASLYPNTMTVSVGGCCGFAVQGATVTVSVGGGSGTTNSSGVATVAVPCTGTFTVSVSKSRYATYTSGTITAQTGAACSLSVTLSPDSTHVCAFNCDTPAPKTLTLTDSMVGTTTITYNGSGAYTGSQGYSFPGTYPCHSSCLNCPAAAVTINYTLTVGCSWSLSVSWKAKPNPLDSPSCQLINFCPDDTGTNNQTATCPNNIGFCQNGSFSCPPTFSIVCALCTCIHDPNIPNPCVAGNCSTITITE